MTSSLKDFFLHLRLNYQFFILSGAFLIGGLLSNGQNFFPFFLQFLNVHIFLFGGVTAYNSYWDKDEGPIGGLKNPPKMEKWMLYASWSFQCIGFVIAIASGFSFLCLYAISMIFFWLYSSPKTRWKAHPFLSMAAIGISTGLAPVFMGFLSIGGNKIFEYPILFSIGITFCLLSFYPLSQLYQVEEDTKRGDVTFAVQYGKAGVKKLFSLFFPLGIIFTFMALRSFYELAAYLFLLGSLLIGLLSWRVMSTIAVNKSSYESVMRLKYVSGITLALFSIAVLIVKFFRVLW
jgi:1,4-dihydroxy-2-naphthoate octaprenyltransferase